MRKILFLFIIIITNNTFSQVSNNEEVYIRLVDYKKIFKTKLKKKDSIRIKYIHGDTLILVKKQKIVNKKIDSIKLIQKNTLVKTYIPLQQYKSIYKTPLTKEDSLSFIFKNKDTLVLINNKDFFKNKKGVSVEYEPKDSSFLEIYKDIVYRKRRIKAENNKEFMRMWKTQIKLFFDKSLDPYYKKAILDASKYLDENVDSLSFKEVKKAKKANYIIYQIDEKHSKKYSENITNNQYIDYYLFWKKGRIYDAKLEINLLKYKNLSKEINVNYLLQNFYKTLGRFYESDKLNCKSIFSNCNANNKILTLIDLEIIKYHYSYGICKFTDLKTFEENHQKAKEELLKGNKMMFIHFD